MSIASVIIVGAGGNLGPSILAALTPSFTVSVLSRSSSTSTFPPSVSVKTVPDSYPHAALVAAFKGQDAVVSAIAGKGVGLQKALIDAAVEAGVKRFVPAEWGSDTTSEEVLQQVPLFKGKADIQEYLKAKESEAFSWTAVANGAFFDWGLHAGFLKVDLKTRKALVLDDGNAKWPASTLAQVGLASARVLQRAEQTRNKFLFIQSFRVSQNQILQSLEKATATTWEVEKKGSTDFIADANGRAAKGDVSGFYDGIFAHAISEANWEGKDGYANELLGLETQDLDEEVRKALKA